MILLNITLKIDHKFAKYLKGNCGLNFEQIFLFKYFLKKLFVREISTKRSATGQTVEIVIGIKIG